MNTADILEAAAAEIERSGLHKGVNFGGFFQYSASEGPCCLGGAIMRAIARADNLGNPRNVSVFDTDAFKAMEQHLDIWPPHWNDMRHRTADEVVNALRAAAAAVREGSK